MYQEHESIVYYVTVYNENYANPGMPAGAEEGVLKGIYRFQEGPPGALRVQLFGSGSLMQQALEAQQLLAGAGIAADVWSVTSYTELYRDAVDAEEQARLDPVKQRKPYITQVLQPVEGPFVAVTDYMRSLPESVSRWVPGRLVSLGTDGFGLSETRASLREHFKVNARSIAAAAVYALGEDDRMTPKARERALSIIAGGPETDHLDYAADA
jgi:pyruvate dehydrogenase E1 component